MSLTLVFFEVTNFTSQEISELRKLTYSEIFWQLDKIFCVTENVSKDGRYSQIIPYTTRITSLDGVNLYVAKKKNLLVCSEPTIRDCMSDYSNERSRVYADVTEISGEVIGGIRTVQKDGESIDIKTEYKIPIVHEGGRLFYVAS